MVLIEGIGATSQRLLHGLGWQTRRVKAIKASQSKISAEGNQKSPAREVETLVGAKEIFEEGHRAGEREDRSKVGGGEEALSASFTPLPSPETPPPAKF